MKKRVFSWVNLLLGSCIVALGFGSCRTSKPVVEIEEPIVDPPPPIMPRPDSVYIQRPIEPPVTVYGPPSMMMRQRQNVEVPQDEGK